MIHITKFNLSSFKFGRDVALYALGIGACARDAVDADELKYVYHENGQQSIQVCQVEFFFFFLFFITNHIEIVVWKISSGSRFNILN